ncbi:helix-turn-helix transcriptional regulator [Nostoc sp. FACHB-888]|uniref:helix-turn-helix domain-containing protein n=1 Tax=Nostoc sp. FACHB-888 TaxID=2692842 RepID=UPI00321FCBD5
MTQEKFAAKLGVTFLTINRWENGHPKRRSQTLACYRMANYKSYHHGRDAFK